METLYTQARGGRENYIVIQVPTQGTLGDGYIVALRPGTTRLFALKRFMRRLEVVGRITL